jgi:hypothetical protein
MYFDEKMNRYKMILRIEDMNNGPIVEELKKPGL